MERFAQSQGPALAEELGDAVHGRGAFRHFKAVVRRRGVEQQWYQFRDEHYAQVARDWLRGHEIELE
ncbi:MAG: UPF0158 family protein [Myxococcales bacterium]|nr:UPF0158 family protein [Myxococcales bacterium]